VPDGGGSMIKVIAWLASMLLSPKALNVEACRMTSKTSPW
jgi:hypothetical protein